MKVLFWNLNVVGTDKLVQLEEFIVGYEAILVVEWGKGEELSSFLHDLGFVSYFNQQSTNGYTADGRRRRGAGKGEGICIFVRSDISSKLVKHSPHSTWVEVLMDGKQVALGYAYYLHPYTSRYWGRNPTLQPDEAREAAFQSIRDDLSVLKASHDHVLLMKDFNARMGRLQDIDPCVQGILGSMDLLDEEVVSEHIPAARQSQDIAAADP